MLKISLVSSNNLTKEKRLIENYLSKDSNRLKLNRLSVYIPNLPSHFTCVFYQGSASPLECQKLPEFARSSSLTLVIRR